jgi:hypothetical protein
MFLLPAYRFPNDTRDFKLNPIWCGGFLASLPSNPCPYHLGTTIGLLNCRYFQKEKSLCPKKQQAFCY